MDKVGTIGLDLAKQVFQVKGRMLLALSSCGNDCAGLLCCNQSAIRSATPTARW
jgi:hypothetical protein